MKSDNLQYNMYTGTLVPSIKQQQQEQTGGSAATMKSKPNEVVAEFFVSLLFVGRRRGLWWVGVRGSGGGVVKRDRDHPSKAQCTRFLQRL